MNDLIPCITNTITAEEKGRQLYHANRNYRNMATVMEHPEFRSFFQTYMNDWNSAKTVLMMMKMYDAIGNRTGMENLPLDRSEKTGSTSRLTPYEKIAILDEFVQNAEIRQRMVECMQKWSESVPDQRFLVR